MDFTETRVSGETKYTGKIVNVYLDDIVLHDGRPAIREVVEHPGGVSVIPIDSDMNCYMVRQYRYPMHRMMLEVPAGKLEKGEDIRYCAERELSEETGFSADELIYLGAFCTSPGFCTEVLHIYLALGLHAGDSHPDDGEFLNLEKYKLNDLVDMVMNNELDDCKTVIAILKAKKYLETH